MSDQMQPNAYLVGTWPLAPGTYDPALDDAGIPNGAVIFGLFNEDFTKYDAPESIPGLVKVSSSGELTDNTYYVLNASSGFDYILVNADTADLSVKIIKKKTEINAFLEHKEDDTPSITLLKDFYAGKTFNMDTKSYDLDATSKIVANNATWRVCPGFPDGGTYRGIDEIFNSFYPNLLKHFFIFYGFPEVFIDGGDVVTVLGFYNIAINEGDSIERIRFSHTFKFAADGRIAGVWQVADSYVIQKCLNAV